MIIKKYVKHHKKSKFYYIFIRPSDKPVQLKTIKFVFKKLLKVNFILVIVENFKTLISQKQST